MDERTASSGRSQDYEKHDGNALEMVTSQTPVHEQDKPPQLSQVGSGGDSNVVVHEKMNFKLFITLVCMVFLWVGSQIPLFIFGSIISFITRDLGGADRFSWFMIAYLIPLAALLPFVGALSDLFGRQRVAIAGQLALVIGAIVTSTASNMNIAIGGQVFSGIGAGLNEMISLSGTAEVVPVKDRAKYIGFVVITIIPFCPAVLWSQTIAEHGAGWRYNGIFVGVWNFIGLLMCIFFYRSPSRLSDSYTARDVISKLDLVGGFLSTSGITLFMMGLQWGSVQYNWGSVHNLVPFILGLVLIAAFVVWEFRAEHPMVPRGMFAKAKRTMIVILLLIFISGGTFFALILIYPSQVLNVYGNDPTENGLRSLPIGFGIMGGAFIGLLLIPITGGRFREIMIFITSVATASTALLSINTPHNVGAIVAIASVACTAIGAVIIPSTVIAQIAAPDEYIATVTALTLSIRYIGGAIGYSIYINLMTRQATKYLGLMAQNTIALQAIVNPLIPAGREAIKNIVVGIANGQFEEVQRIMATDPTVLQRDAYPIILAASREAWAQAYKLPYYVSIAFGGATVILSFFIGDIRQYMTSKIAVHV
ncbi:hypothetical protein COCCADRAFT_7762 [Bipolaris zeicola 26-R-13]|uniref:Major facilitator superfamily (MFS) profile domain-containing protein n=1 Tax=Cochliobolus carbonum (strain 26-R-13) TaxID=930089 RepID=W6XWK0_COCC2|nr:uncharacterized protein COCCADRAFT_7762 [Bipolaris zeicola 26-R-13]EUC30153.1 hypothetical protein COCCADRAFT_7762 [Bipolaris zeicola 26-R-13]